MLEEELINIVSNGNPSIINIVILGYLYFLHQKIKNIESMKNHMGSNMIESSLKKDM